MTEDRQRWTALYVLCVGMLMIILDATIVNVALPSIQDDLGFSQSNLAWVVNAYLIAFGGLLLLAGRLGDLVGQRRVFLTGLAVFTSASLLCAVAQTQGMLVGARFVQGVGGALTSAVILGMIVTMFPEPREQAKAIGVYTFTAVAGGSVGLLLGGALTEALNWHWIFFVNLPIGVATGLYALRVVEDRPGIGLQQGADLPGAVLLTGGLMLLVYAIVGAGEHGWGSAQTLGLGAVSLALLAAFVSRQARVDTPLMPLRLFRSPNVTGANAVQALMVVGLYGMFFLGALYMQRILGYDPLEVGLAFLPTTLVMGAMSFSVSARLNLRYGPEGDADSRHRGRGRRAPAVRAHAGERRLRGRHPALDPPAGPRRRPRLPVADDARDVGRHAERLGARLRAREHLGAGGRGTRARGARHRGERPHRIAAGRRRDRRERPQLGLPPRVPDRGGLDRRRAGGGLPGAPRGAGA